MNFIQTLYITADKSLFRDSFGWVSPEYHLTSWALSCLQLHKLYGNVELFANSSAADLLVGTLDLPYSKVHTSHDSLELAHNELWALPKLYTYSLQNEPFLHIDGDVFLFRKFNKSLLTGDLIGQNIEVATEYYNSTQRELMQHFTYFPDCVKRDFDSGTPINAVNAGILGGKNIPFFEEYTNLAFEYIYRNIQNFKNILVDRFNVFFEQHLFHALLKEKQLNINLLIEDTYKDNAYDIGNFIETPFECTYVHLLGDFKRDDYTCRQMVAKLRELYPEYYYRIIALFRKKNIPISPFCFCESDFENKHNTAIQLYKNKEHFYSAENQIFKDEKNTLLKLLKNISKESENENAKQDFETFYSNLLDKINYDFSEIHLYGRDLESASWYRSLFENTENLLQKQIVSCKEITVIPSNYNWAGLFNKYYKSGAKFYASVQFKESDYLNLIVLEATKNRFSLYDIDNLDSSILDFCKNNIVISDLLEILESFFEDNVIKNHYDTFFYYVVSRIKFLVEIKAVKPVEQIMF